MATYEDIKKANELLRSMNIRGKDYVEVNQRILAFRMVYPDGTIDSVKVSDDGNRCDFEVSIYDGEHLLARAHAYEEKGTGMVNPTSYIENCETSAVGRALGLCGFGVDASLASAEEVKNAMEKKEQMKAPPQSSQNSSGEPPVQRGKKAPIVCEKCGEVITEKVQTFSQQRFGKSLCMKCQREEQQT